MERREFDSKIRGGLVRAAINQYGDGKGDGISWKKSLPQDSSEYSLKARELQKAKTDIDHYKKSRNAADSFSAQAQLELLNAKNTVKNLSSLFDKSNATARVHKRELETLKKSSSVQDSRLAVASSENHEYVDLMRELESAKLELSKLKLDVSSVFHEKLQAEKEKEEAILKFQSLSSSIEELRKEIDEINEEQVLVELAQIEALKEFQEIEAQRSMEAKEFLCAIENKRKNINDLVQEVEGLKELEKQFSLTMSDVNVLQRELKLVKELDIKAQRKVMMTELERKSQVEEDELLLQSITEELKTAKKDLALIRDEGFQFMTSMDAVRRELKHVKEEIANLKKPDENRDSIVQKLNSKLLRAKTKLEAVSSAEEKVKAIASNLSISIEQMKKETEAAKKEKELTDEEIKNIKAEIQKTESEIDLNEECLQDALQELEKVKSSEALVLANLKSLTESTMRSRASATKSSSFITISRFEYEYLAGRAVAAQEIADKKVAAAQAWIEAINASEVETRRKCELAELEIGEMRMEEEKQAYRANRSLSAKRMVEGELQNWRQKREKNAEDDNEEPANRQKSIRRNGSMTPSRRLKFRISASPSPHMMNGRTASFSMQKRTKVVKNLAKFFNGKKAKMNP
ncbi:protein PLASTID MOVEMENT IMPAIRED 2 isoform X2 [Benincasa hispida]|nr:protein PLASTID MOVEMENT IMPAIRED 2 isoform X2 [Benincasa hispida]